MAPAGAEEASGADSETAAFLAGSGREGGTDRQGARNRRRGAFTLAGATALVLAVSALLLGFGRDGLHRLRDGGLELKEAAGQCGAPQAGVDLSYERGVSIDRVQSPELCCARCTNVPFCQAWTWVGSAYYSGGVRGQCWLKSGYSTGSSSKPDAVSGQVAGQVMLRHASEADVQSYGCARGVLPSVAAAATAGAPAQLKLLSYNLEWWKVFDTQGGWGAEGVIKQAGMPDIMAFQECEDPFFLMEHVGLSDTYGALQGTDALCLAYLRTSWSLLSNGQVHLAQDMQHAAAGSAGQRDAQWMRVQHLQSGRAVLFVNHHGPLPLNSGGACGAASVAYNLLTVIAQNAGVGDAVFLVGDFNANAGSPTIQSLKQRLQGVYSNNLDHVFSNLGPESFIQRSNLGGGGSDHDAITVTAQLGAAAAPYPYGYPAQA